MNIFFGELIGTMLLVLLGNGAMANVMLTKSRGENSGWIVISAGWGIGISLAIYAAGWASGGHLNPAVTLGFLIAGKTSLALLPIYFIAQLLGAIVGAVLVWIAYLPHWDKTKDHDHKLICFCTKPAVPSPWSNLGSEIIATGMFLVGVLSIVDTHNSLTHGVAPFLVGLLMFGVAASLGGPTGFAINPARDLGPRIAHALLPIQGKGSSDWMYAPVPIIGPFIGAVLGSWLYIALLASL